MHLLLTPWGLHVTVGCMTTETVHALVCPTCSTPWECRCGHEPCLFEGNVCDGCQLERLEANATATDGLIEGMVYDLSPTCDEVSIMRRIDGQLVRITVARA